MGRADSGYTPQITINSAPDIVNFLQFSTNIFWVPKLNVFFSIIMMKISRMPLTMSQNERTEGHPPE